MTCFGLAAAEAIYSQPELSDAWREDLLTYLRGNLELLQDYAYNRFHRHGVILSQPTEATYLIWFDARMLQNTLRLKQIPDISTPYDLFESYGVGLTDGKPFAGEGYIRINFALPRDRLHEALERMAQALEENCK